MTWQLGSQDANREGVWNALGEGMLPHMQWHPRLVKVLLYTQISTTVYTISADLSSPIGSLEEGRRGIHGLVRDALTATSDAKRWACMEAMLGQTSSTIGHSPAPDMLRYAADISRSHAHLRLPAGGREAWTSALQQPS